MGVHDRDHRPRAAETPALRPAAGCWTGDGQHGGDQDSDQQRARAPRSSPGGCTVLVVPVADVVGELLPGRGQDVQDEHRPGHPAHPGQPVQHQIRIRWPGQRGEDLVDARHAVGQG